MDKAKELLAKFQQDLRLVEADIVTTQEKLKEFIDRKARLLGGLETTQVIIATDPNNVPVPTPVSQESSPSSVENDTLPSPETPSMPTSA